MDATSLENACRLSIEWLRAQAGAALAGHALPPRRQQDPLYQSTFRRRLRALSSWRAVLRRPKKRWRVNRPRFTKERKRQRPTKIRCRGRAAGLEGSCQRKELALTPDMGRAQGSDSLIASCGPAAKRAAVSAAL